MSSSKEKFGKTHSWKDIDKILRLCLINIYQGKIVQPWGTIIHLITKLQLLALNFKFTYKFLPESTTPITDFTNLIADIFIFKDLFSFTDESDLTKVVFVLVHVYNFILIAILLYLSSLVIRKKPINERFQSFWSVGIYLHCLIFLFPSFNFSVAGIVDWANGDLKIFSPSSVNQVLVPVFSLLTITWNVLLIVFSNVFLMTSLRSNGPLCLKTNTLQRSEIIEKCLLFLLSYAISDMEITSWIVLIASLLIILSKNFYVFSLLPYYDIQIQVQETIMNSLTAPLATLNIIAKAIARTRHVLGSSEIIIAWLLFCPFAAKLNWNRLYKIYSTLLGTAITATSPSHILHRIPLYNLFLKRKIDFNPKADTVDFTNLYIKGKSKIMKPYVKETGEEVDFDLANDQHFKIYSLSLLKDGIKLHNNYWPMKVAYIRQLIEYSYYIQALYFIEQTKKGNLDLTQKIMLHLLKSEIECILMRKYLNQKSDKLNILKFLRSTYIYDKLRHEIMQQLQNQQGFWYSYLPNKTNFKTLINFSNKIDFKKSKLEKFWKQYESSVEENFVSPYLTFGVYLELANYRPTRGSQVIKQYLRKARGAERIFVQDELSNDTIFASDNVCIEISGVKQTLGRVLECSHSVRKIFGFNRDHMIGQNVEMIIPDYLKDKHNSALYRYYETGKKSVLNHTRQVLAMTSSGYLLPTYLHVRLNPFLENKISYVGLMRPVKQNLNCFIVLPDGTIDGLTKEIAAELNLTPNLKLNILEICSEFQTVNEVTNRVAHHELAKKQDFQMLFKNVNKMSQASPRKPRGSTLTKTIGHEELTIASPSITDRKLLVTSRADVTTPSKSIVSKGFSNIFFHNSIQNLDYESVLQLYSKYSQEGVEVTFRCFPGHRESSYEGIRELKAQIRVENMIMGHDFVKVVYINTILEKKMEKPMTRRRGAVTLTKMQSMQSDSSKGQEQDRGKAFEMLYKNPIASVLNHIKISSQSSSGDINEDIGSPFKLNTFRAQGDPDASPIKSSRIMKEETHESLERNNPSVPHMNYKITVNSESNMSPTNRQKSSRELQGIQIASKQIKELSEIESKNDEEDPENNRNIEIKDGNDKLSQKENKGDSKDVKNMVQFNDRASRDGLSSEQSIKLKIQKGVESSLEVRHKSKKFAFFIIAFVLCMALIALVLLSQMLSAIDAFTDVSNSNQIITLATGMLDSLVYVNFMLRIWYCLIEGKFGYIPEPAYSALMEGQQEGMENYITTLSVANNNLTSAVTMLDEDLQNAFYIRNVRVFEVDKDNKPGEFTLDNTFTAIQKIVSKGFRFLAAPSYPIYQPNLEMLYFLYNCYNDLLISNENSVSILLADMQDKISSYKETLWSVSTSSSIILILFLISSLIIVYQMKKSVLSFGVFFFTINQNDVKSILASLNNFHKVLNHNYQDEVLLAHLQVSERNHKHKGDQAKLRPSEKDILYNQYHLQNQLLVSRLWILVGLVMGLLIGFTAMKLNDIDHISKLHEQSVASGDNLVKSNLVISILVELAGANETTTIKNLPIVNQFQIYLKSLSQSGDLINAFKDDKGQIESNKAEFLANFSCNSYIDDLYSDLSDFRESCYNVSGQQGYTSVITLNNQVWQLATDLYTSFSQSNRTTQDQVYFLATGDALFPPMINVGRVLNFELWRRVLTDFELFLESRRSQTIAFSIYFEVLILIITLFAFPWALTILNNKDYELKKMLKLVPLNVILKNRWLKTYLIKHSNKILDPIKNIL